MSKHETTRREARPAEKIDFRELDNLINKAKDGDEIANQEINNLSQSIKESGFIDKIADLVFDNNAMTDFSKRIISAYIDAFNKWHETDFESLEDIEKYIKDHELSADGEVNFYDLIESTACRPQNYTKTLGKITDKVFNNELTIGLGQKKKFKIPLNKEETIFVYASINYDKVFEELPEEVKIPELTDDGRQVLDGIISCYLAGNRIMTYIMIYKGFTGDERCQRLPDGVFEMISEALLSFRGWIKIENNKINNNDKKYNEPILIFRQFEETESVVINGKEVKGDSGVIEVYESPVLYRFALLNGNEVDTRPIKLQNVPGINNTRENLRLKRYLYSRVITMRNNYERNVIRDHKRMTVSRKILFSSVFDHIGADKIDRKRKYKIVKKIESILNYWSDFGLIDGYVKTTKNGSKEIDGIEINFIKKIESESKKKS